MVCTDHFPAVCLSELRTAARLIVMTLIAPMLIVRRCTLPGMATVRRRGKVIPHDIVQ